MPPRPEIVIRPGIESDAASLLEIHRRAILMLGRSAYSEAECASWAAGLTPEGYVRGMTTNGETFLVAEDDEGLCGFCSFKNDELVGLYVHPRMSRRGVGSMLLARAEAALSASGCDSLRIEAALSAIQFYQARGYRIVRRRRTSTRGGLEVEVCDLEKRRPLLGQAEP